jgi:predicted PurR-regulated permease PerM
MSKMPNQKISNHIKIVLFIFLLIGLVWFFAKVFRVVELVIISLMLVYALFPLTEYLESKRRFPHFWAVLTTYVCFLLIILAIIGLVIPVVYNEVHGIMTDLPFYFQQFQNLIEDSATQLDLFDLGTEITNTVQNISANIQPLLEEIASFSISLISSFINIFFILFIVFFLLFDFKSIRSKIMELLPAQYQNQWEEIIGIIDINLGRFIRGNIIRCTIVGVLTGSVLFAAGMPYAFLLGVLAGALNVILYIGPYIAAAPAVLLSFSANTPSFLFVVITYVVINIIDGVLLSPLLLGRAVSLKPITVIIALLIGAELAGVLGMIISTPLAGIVRGLVEHFAKGKEGAV